MADSSSNSDLSEDEYQVEKIIDIKTKGNKSYYLVKWKGYPMEDNTWEPEGNVSDCMDLVKQCQARLVAERKRPNKADRQNEQNSSQRSSQPSSSSTSSSKAKPSEKQVVAETNTADVQRNESHSPPKKSKAKQPRKPSGFGVQNEAMGWQRGLEPEAILGATDSTGELLFLMKWKDSSECDLVRARDANQRCPQVVIKFYEARLTWRGRQDGQTSNAADTNSAGDSAHQTAVVPAD